MLVLVTYDVASTSRRRRAAAAPRRQGLPAISASACNFPSSRSRSIRRNGRR